MQLDLQIEQRLIQKIQQLPAHQVVEVEDFIDFLAFRNQSLEQKLVTTASQLSEKAFAEVWDNPEDADYDNL